jgi:hypothetical protein
MTPILTLLMSNFPVSANAESNDTPEANLRCRLPLLCYGWASPSTRTDRPFAEADALTPKDLAAMQQQARTGLSGDAEFHTLPSSPPFGQRSFSSGTVSAIPEPSSVVSLLAWVP